MGDRVRRSFSVEVSLATQAVGSPESSPSRNRQNTATFDRNLAIIQRRLAGEKLEAIASDYGLTRERVRQIALKCLGPDLVGAMNSQRSEASARESYERAYPEVVACQVCLKPMRRRASVRPVVSHRGECARLRIAALYVLSDKRRLDHHKKMAEYYLANPEKSGPYRVRWAERYLRGEAGTHGRWFIEGSKVHKAWLRILELREGRTA